MKVKAREQLRCQKRKATVGAARTPVAALCSTLTAPARSPRAVQMRTAASPEHRGRGICTAVPGKSCPGDESRRLR